ncbi:hypothetical protein [Fischerella thermalis]|nr:hypothetical protein [Fischerella thermalis]
MDARRVADGRILKRLSPFLSPGSRLQLPKPERYIDSVKFKN